MSEYTVEEIKKEAKKTLAHQHGRNGTTPYTFSLYQIRNECQKVLFLCREIEKLKKGLK